MPTWKLTQLDPQVFDLEGPEQKQMLDEASNKGVRTVPEKRVL